MVERYVKEFMRDFADFIFTKSQENLTDMGIDDTGALRLSGEILEEGDDIIISYSAPYATDVNDGTQPHPVSYKVLLSWVERKLGVPKKDVVKVAKAIAAKIKRMGTDPKPYMDNAIEVAKVKYKGKVDLT